MKSLIISILITCFTFASLSQQTGSFTDPRDGKTYKTVNIGNQLWMAENIAYKAKSGCWAYDNKTGNAVKFGYLYDWETANYACPSGWRLPSKNDFETLLNNVGGSGSVANQALIPGGSSGFSAPFGGWRYLNGSFYFIGKYAYFWSSSALDVTYAWSLLITSGSSGDYMGSRYRILGLSVRCLQDN